MGVATWYSDINCQRWAFAMLSRHHRRAAIRAELCCVSAVLDQTLDRMMFYIDLVHHGLVAKLVALQSALTLLYYEIIDGCRKSPQDPLL